MKRGLMRMKVFARFEERRHINIESEQASEICSRKEFVCCVASRSATPNDRQRTHRDTQSDLQSDFTFLEHDGSFAPRSTRIRREKLRSNRARRTQDVT